MLLTASNIIRNDGIRVHTLFIYIYIDFVLPVRNYLPRDASRTGRRVSLPDQFLFYVTGYVGVCT